MKKQKLTLSSKSLSFQIGTALIAGLTIGFVLRYLGYTDPKAPPLDFTGRLSKSVIDFIKGCAGPLLFFAILETVLKTKIQAKMGARLIQFAAINALFALVIGIGFANFFRPGDHLANVFKAGFFQPQQTISTLDSFFAMIPTNPVKPFLDANILQIIILALLVGFGLRSTDLAPQAYKFAESALKTVQTILHWVIRLVPLSIFGALVKTVAEHGFSSFKGLSYYMLVGVAALATQILFVYQAWIKYYAKISLKKFWKTSKEAVLYAFGCNSSLATLPLTLEALDKLEVSPAASRLGACVGTNLNNDGILLYEAMAVYFVAQAYGVHLSLTQQVTAAFSSVIAAIGIAGIPEAGIISLSLVLSTVGLSTEILPILMTVDWILARVRSVTNVLSDMTISIMLDTAEKKSAR